MLDVGDIVNLLAGLVHLRFFELGIDEEWHLRDQHESF
jgi:hypothetical protein